MAYSFTTQLLYAAAQRLLLEKTVDAGVTWQLHTATEIHNYLNHRISRFLVETGILRTNASIPVVSGTHTYSLTSTLIDLWRVVWVPTAAGTHTVLERTDPWALDASRPSWQSLSGAPDSYIIEPLDILTIRLVPNPNEAGAIQIISTDNQTALGAADTALPLPGPMAVYLLWGVVADALSKQGEGHDPIRAAYAEERFAEGVELTKLLLQGSY